MTLYLLAALVLPIIAAPIALILGRRAGVGVAVVVAVALGAVVAIATPEDSFQAGGVTLAVGPIARLFLPMLLPAMVICCAFADPDTELFVPGALLITGAITGVVLVDNPFLACLFLELAGVLVLFLLPRRQHEASAAASGVKTLTLTVISSTMLLAAFSLNETYRVGGQNPTLIQLILALLTIGLGLRLAAFPFHLWLPNLAEEAPPAAVALVSAVVNVAAIALLLSTFASAPWLIADEANRALLAGGCALGAAAGGLLAAFQNDLRRIVACATVAQIGFVLFGITYGPPSLSAGLFAVAAYVLTIVLLWLTVYQVEQRAGTTLIGMVSGLRAQLPVTAIGFLVAGLTAAGMPLLAAFPSRWVVWRVAGDVSPSWSVALIAASALLLFTYLRAFRSLFLGPPSEGLLKPESRAVNAGIVTLMGISIAMGLLPGPILDAIAATVRSLAFLQ